MDPAAHPAAHLEYLNDTLLIVCDVNPFKHLTVLAPTQLADNLVAVLVPNGGGGGGGV